MRLHSLSAENRSGVCPVKEASFTVGGWDFSNTPYVFEK
jgi:hypothetical protein